MSWNEKQCFCSGPQMTCTHLLFCGYLFILFYLFSVLLLHTLWLSWAFVWSCVLLPLRCPHPLVSWSAPCLWNKLLLRRNPGNQSPAPSRAPWPAALSVGFSTSFQQIFYIYSLVVFFCVFLINDFLVFSPACEDALTPAAVAESAMKVLKSCLATMPAGRRAQSRFLATA